MITKKRIIAAMLAAPAAFAVAAPAHAQVSGGVATVNLVGVVTHAKALDGAEKAIEAKYKKNFDDMDARQAKFEADVKPLLAAIDTNKDGKISEQEENAAKQRKDPSYAKIADLQNTANADQRKLQLPMIVSELYAIEKVLDLYDAAQQRVATDRKIAMIVAPTAVVWAPDAADISQVVLAEVDKTPSVSIDAPANWQPSERAVNFQRSWTAAKYQAYQAAALQQAQQQQQQGAAPAAATPRPAAPAGGAKPTKPEPR